METKAHVEQEFIQAVLSKLAAQYRTSITLLGGYEQAGTEPIYDYQLKLMAVEEAISKVASEQGLDDSLYRQFMQEYQTFSRHNTYVSNASPVA